MTFKNHTPFKLSPNKKRIKGLLAAIVKSIFLALLFFNAMIVASNAATVEFNTNGGSSSTNGLHFYIDESSQIQVKRLDNSGQVYSPNTLPPNVSMDNGIFLRANGLVYGPNHDVSDFNPSGGNFSTHTITAASPANPSSNGTQQTATQQLGITSGPQITVLWKYTTPFDFITAEVTVVIPSGYAVNSGNPVRYYHVFDTYLGGSDNGCGVKYTDSNGKLVVGTYPPVSGNCPSSTAVPNDVSVVESFRERSGLSFSNYCANDWSSFWANGGVNCSILQSSNMSNAISTSKIDTGIGIQYNFTATGTYTFSYDFVVGSTKVPDYDHLEIQHAGTSNLCPSTIKVLACTSSTIPCPAGNIVNTGALTGNVTNTPSLPTVTKTPASFTIDSTHTSPEVTLQGSGAGTYVLSANSLSKSPLNGTKCWNTTTSTASCSFTVTASACVSNFECIETGLPYNNITTSPTLRNPLYTKIAGTGFKFDVVALQSGGTQALSYTAASGVTVELFDDAASPQPACIAYTSPIASQAITFTTTDAGRKTLTANFTVANAYKKLRCRVKDTNVSVSGCSSDNFSVRPDSFSVTSSNAIADAANTSHVRDENATPLFKAGATNFNLTASTNVAGYNGTPTIRTPSGTNEEDVYSWAHGAAPLASDSYSSPSTFYRSVGRVTGSFGAANATTGNASGNAFTYSEAGYFRFQANSIVDTTFTAIDQTSGDCNPDYVAGNGKNACYIGHSSRTPFFGRFIPDHFSIAPSPTITPACSNAFTYFGQDGLTTTFNIEAQNLAGQITKNYTNNAASEGEYYGKLNLTSPTNFNFLATNLPAGTTLTSNITTPGSWIRGVATVTAKHTVSRLASATPPASIRITTKPLDSDGVTIAANTALGDPTAFRYGRLYMTNTYGSELLPLTVPIQAQYWNGLTYLLNTQDSCTSFTNANIGMANYKSNLSGSPTCETKLSGAGTMNLGLEKVSLSPPGWGNNGSVDLTLFINNTPTGNTCNATSPTTATAKNYPWFGTVNPSARATFGLFKSPMIYMRENY